jgi:large subunit ribosomal protein L23
MNASRMVAVIKGPHTSEKTTIIAEAHSQITLKVCKTASKKEIKKAVEELFDVKVKAVKTALLKGKTKRFGQRLGKRNDFKKAYITLQDGHDINFAVTE